MSRSQSQWNRDSGFGIWDLSGLVSIGIRFRANPESPIPNPNAIPMQFLDALNPEQREAVLHIRGPLLILAGAGSGKTRVITSRITYLPGDGHAEPHEVLAVTCTTHAD